MAPTSKAAEGNESFSLTAPKGIIYMVVACLVGAGGGSAMAGGLAAHSNEPPEAATVVQVGLTKDEAVAIVSQAEERARASAIATATVHADSAIAPLAIQIQALSAKFSTLDKALDRIETRQYETIQLLAPLIKQGRVR
jgi:hypothetical protein